jgi:predicted transposase YbfD/YdcC
MPNSQSKLLKKFPNFHSFFISMTDPRRTDKGKFYYPLQEILFLTIASVISGADNWTAISRFGKAKLEWLRNYYPYENGIPSHDVLGDLFARIDHSQFASCFTEWVNSMSVHTNGEVIAIDGKTICNSGNKTSGKSAIHVVSAYAATNKLCLGQQVTEQKSNEITAIPELLKILDIKDCIVTIDAMGCQKKIAQSIIDQDADYILMVKGNQKELKTQVEKMFNIGKVSDSYTQIDSGHGRIETRKCDIICDLTFMDDKEDWPALTKVIRVQSERHDKQNNKTAQHTRFYIGSGLHGAKQINDSVREHWSVENNLHWSLDVIFKEDASLKKKGNSAENYNIILKMALALIEKEKSTKASKPIKRLNAAWDDKYRDKLLKC